MPSEAVIITSQHPDSNDLNLAKLIQSQGINHTLLRMSASAFNPDFLAENIRDNAPCLFINAGALADASSGSAGLKTLKSFIQSKESIILVYNVTPAESHISALKSLTGGLVRSVMPFGPGDLTYDVSHDNRSICRHMSGISYFPVRHENDFALSLESSPNTEVSTLISIDKKPFFVLNKTPGSRLFCLANNRVLDIDSVKTMYRLNIREYFSGIVPFVMFIRYVFGTMCWHRPVSQASCILDDPLLKEPYGLLSYPRLLQTMDEHNFFMNIAFIPWNHKRTQSEVAHLLNSRPDRFHLCIHGCNHTQGEFESTDVSELNRLINQALERMRHHQELTGLGFDKIMVFPQSLFSIEAMKMLKCNNFLSAVDITIQPHNIRRQGIAIDSQLNLAVMDYHAFPLVIRRLHDDVRNFAFDLFTGKPALIYLHHDDIKDGAEALLETVTTINAMPDSVSWLSLGDIVRSLYYQKSDANDDIAVKCYARECLISNPSPAAKTYRISKQESETVPLESATLDGRNLDYDLSDGWLSFSVEIPPKSQIELKITYKNDVPYISRKAGFVKELRIWTRRRLSEFRERTLSKSPVLTAMVNRILGKGN